MVKPDWVKLSIQKISTFWDGNNTFNNDFCIFKNPAFWAKVLKNCLISFVVACLVTFNKLNTLIHFMEMDVLKGNFMFYNEPLYRL